MIHLVLAIEEFEGEGRRLVALRVNLRRAHVVHSLDVPARAQARSLASAVQDDALHVLVRVPFRPKLRKPRDHRIAQDVQLIGAVQRDDAHGGHGVDEYIVRVGGHLGEGRGFGRDAGDDDTRASKCRISRVTIR
eukprot:30828-Pelagococcus_subviridis.AAC.13